jgi:hypothetical protein
LCVSIQHGQRWSHFMSCRTWWCSCSLHLYPHSIILTVSAVVHNSVSALFTPQQSGRLHCCWGYWLLTLCEFACTDSSGYWDIARTVIAPLSCAMCYCASIHHGATASTSAVTYITARRFSEHRFSYNALDRCLVYAYTYQSCCYIHMHVALACGWALYLMTTSDCAWCILHSTSVYTLCGAGYIVNYTVYITLPLQYVTTS